MFHVWGQTLLYFKTKMKTTFNSNHVLSTPAGPYLYIYRYMSYIYMYMYVYTYQCTHGIHVSICVFIHLCVCMYIYMYIDVYLYMYVYVYVCISYSSRQSTDTPSSWPVVALMTGRLDSWTRPSIQSAFRRPRAEVISTCCTLDI